MPEDDVTLVLVHGAGHTRAVWRAVQDALRRRSFAVDLPGRGSRPADLTRLTVDEAASSIADDVTAEIDGDVVLVGHSVGATVLPAAAALLEGRVRHLVFVGGIAATDGERPVDIFLPERADAVAAHLADLRARHGGRTLEDIGDVRVASSIDSLTLSTQPMRWTGVADDLPRTFVRCLRDPIQPRDLQDRFIVNCGATTVVDVDTGHTPALDAPEVLAGILDAIPV